MSWKGENKRHSMASRGIHTKQRYFITKNSGRIDLERLSKIEQIPTDSYEDAMTILANDRPELVNGVKPAYIKYSEDGLTMYASDKPISEDDIIHLNIYIEKIETYQWG